uniref:Putative NAD dependent malic enzyme n=1 Tax=Rhizophora mucronata TaxID=61149 RepID=A0A2P2KWE9_RHIMU
MLVLKRNNTRWKETTQPQSISFSQRKSSVLIVPGIVENIGATFVNDARTGDSGREEPPGSSQIGRRMSRKFPHYLL